MTVSHIICLILGLVTVVVLPYGATGSKGSGHRQLWDPLIRSPVDLEADVDENMTNGTRWAVLVAGSKGFGNYRHQVSQLIT
ncbi:putative legumain protein [Helianthus anomalus]